MVDAYDILIFKIVNVIYGGIYNYKVTDSTFEVSTSSLLYVVVVQSLSHVGLCNTMDCGTLGFPVLNYLPKFAQFHVH